MNLPENKTDLSISINTIIDVWEYNQGEISNDKSLHFEIEETESRFKVTFKFITAVIPVPEPERDEIVWGDDFFSVMKTEPMKKLIHYVHDILDMVSGLKIGSEKETPWDNI